MLLFAMRPQLLVGAPFLPGLFLSVPVERIPLDMGENPADRHTVLLLSMQHDLVYDLASGQSLDSAEDRSIQMARQALIFGS